MDPANNALLEENLALKAALAVAVAKNSEDAALIAAQKLHIAKLNHQIYGHRSERSARLIEQMALLPGDRQDENPASIRMRKLSPSA